MIKKLFSLDVVLCAVALVLNSAPVTAQGNDFCKDFATGILTDSMPDDILDRNVIKGIVNDPSCFIQANLNDEAALKAISPARVSLWNAFQSLSPSQQQGSNLSSSGSTNAVSKTSGPTSLVEEFGGANVTRGTSSTTAQWSPGTMLANLALTGVDYLCLTTNDATGNKEPEGCISPGLLKGLTPLTFKITADTSSGTPSTTGMAATSGSTSSAQPVTVNSKGTSGPSFAGLTVQYSFFSRNSAAVKSLTSKPKTTSATASDSPDLTQYKNELQQAWDTDHALATCDAYKTWAPLAKKHLEAEIQGKSASASDQLKAAIMNEYAKLLTDMLASQSCQPAVQAFRDFYASILEAKTYEDFKAVQSSSVKPELSFEYDLNTPQNKPSYSSAKATVNWQFGKHTVTDPSTSTKSNSKASSSEKSSSDPKRSAGQKTEPNAITEYAKRQINVLTSAAPGNSTNKTKQINAQSQPQAQVNAQPLSFTLTGTADIYNAEPPSSIPSASHLRDIQAGAEIAYVFSPFGKNSVLGSFLGSVTTAAAYSYQDQTSPAILTGPALSDFTGLPSSATAVYAKRGVIHLGQIRLGFGTGKNLTYPLALTYSNRTELITHPTWGLQFGISYNLTSLFNSSGTTKSGNGN